MGLSSGHGVEKFGEVSYGPIYFNPNFDACSICICRPIQIVILHVLGWHLGSILVMFRTIFSDRLTEGPG